MVKKKVEVERQGKNKDSSYSSGKYVLCPLYYFMSQIEIPTLDLTDMTCLDIEQKFPIHKVSDFQGLKIPLLSMYQFLCALG